MTEQDIRGHGAAITGAIALLEQLSRRASRAQTAEQVRAVEQDGQVHKEVIMNAGVALAIGLLVDVNRIAAALEFVAQQHNNSEALFRG